MSPTMPERLATLEAQGRHQGEKLEEFRVEAREDIASLRLEIATVRMQVGEIKEILTQAKGGWKAMVLMGSVAGAVLGAVITACMWLLDAVQPLLSVLPR